LCPFPAHAADSPFLDGHATWINSERLLKNIVDKEMVGVSPEGPNSQCYPGAGEFLF
jgi:hypothetical protein